MTNEMEIKALTENMQTVLDYVDGFLEEIQEMLGHRDISSTNIYSQLVNKQLKDVYNKAHPRA